MATPTVTADVAAAPEPAPAAPSGTLTSFLTPVQPARPVAPIGSTASMAEESIASDNGKPAKQTERNSGPVREHPIGALVRAIAARIGRTGTQNKVTRQHTITESRVSGGSNQTTTANRSSRDGKNHQVGQHRTDHAAKVADNNSKIRQHQGRDQRDVRSADTNASTSASKNGRDVKNHRDAKASGATTASKQDAVVHKTHRDGLDSRPSKATDTTTKKDQQTAAADTTKKPAASTAPKDATAAKDQTAPKTDTAKETKACGDTAAKASRDTKPAGKTLADTKPRPRTQSSREAGYHDGTKAAAVAGHVRAYRDGVQDGYADGTAKYEAERKRMDDAKARNATKPDTRAAKPNMAPASGSTADLPAKPAPADTPPQPQKAPANGTTADMAKKPTPSAPTQTKPAPASGATTDPGTKVAAPYRAPLVEPLAAINIGESRVTYTTDAGAFQGSASRAEIRTLKGFEQRLTAKVPRMQQVAENSRNARATAVDHATRARRLAERARDVEGGGRLIAKLDRLAEQVEGLRNRTVETEKAAHRGADAVRALVSNAEVRHGGIYKAVADSPLTKPAERDFYLDKGSD